MNILDSIEMGRMCDPEHPEIDQEDVNEESMYLLNKKILINDLNNKVSRFTFSGRLKDIDIADNVFWIEYLKEIIKIYSLNSLKVYLSYSYQYEGINHDIKDMILYIKSNLIDQCLYTTFFDDKLTIDEFYNKLTAVKSPKLLRHAIKFIDKESFNNFVITLKKESRKSI